MFKFVFKFLPYNSHLASVSIILHRHPASVSLPNKTQRNLRGLFTEKLSRESPERSRIVAVVWHTTFTIYPEASKFTANIFLAPS